MNFRERQVSIMWAGAGIVIAALIVGWPLYQVVEMVKEWF